MTKKEITPEEWNEIEAKCREVYRNPPKRKKPIVWKNKDFQEMIHDEGFLRAMAYWRGGAGMEQVKDEYWKGCQAAYKRIRRHDQFNTVQFDDDRQFDQDQDDV